MKKFLKIAATLAGISLGANLHAAEASPTTTPPAPAAGNAGPVAGRGGAGVRGARPPVVIPTTPPTDIPAPPLAALNRHAVTLTEDGATYTLDNGVVRALVAKVSGDLISLKYRGLEMLATYTTPEGAPDLQRDPPGDPGRGRGMTDHMYGFWSHDTIAPRTVAKITLDPKTNGGQRAEVSVKGFSDGQKLGHGPGAPADGEFASDIEIRYALGQEDNGVYTYCTFEHLPAYPDATLGEARFCVKLNSIFNWMLVDEHHNLFYPREMEASGDDKYNYTTVQFDHRAFGWASTFGKVGIFFVNASTEYLSGGPTKVEFMTHRDTTGPDYFPCILNYWRSSHYGGSAVDVAAGEQWTKVVGPFLIYCNEGPDPAAIFKDANEQVAREQKKWPYAWVEGVDYPHHDQRSTVSGQLMLKDPLMPNAKMSHLLVGLTHPDYHIPTPRAAASNTPVNITWMTDAKHYEFWARGEDNGKFVVPDVRAGNYTLHAIADGVLGEFAQANVVVAAGQPLDLGSLTWTPVRRGRQLWDIGVANRNGREFLKGDDYFHDGMALVYRDNFPNDVNFVIGQSDYAKDWYFQHVPHVGEGAVPNGIVGGGGAGRASPWTITFDLPKAPAGGVATLRVAIAGGNAGGGGIAVTVNDQPVGAIRMKEGGDSTVGRNGIQGLWYEREVPFPATLLHAGPNVMKLTVPAGGATAGVIYDYLRLELDETATPAPNVVTNP